MSETVKFLRERLDSLKVEPAPAKKTGDGQFRNYLETGENPVDANELQKEIISEIDSGMTRRHFDYKTLFEDGQVDEAYPDDFDSRAFDAQWGAAGEELWAQLADEIKYDADNFDVKEYSNDYDDYAGELDAIVDKLVMGLGVYVDERDKDIFYDMRSELAELASQIVGPNLRRHMGVKMTSGPAYEGFGQRPQFGRRKQFGNLGHNDVQGAIDYVTKHSGKNQWGSTEDLVKRAAGKFSVDPMSIRAGLSKPQQFQKLNQDVNESILSCGCDKETCKCGGKCGGECGDANCLCECGSK